MKTRRCDISVFSQRLRQLREERGLSMDAFCEKYNEMKGSRLSKSTVSRWENGSQEPMLSTVASLADFFGVAPTYLIGNSDDRNCTASNIQNSAVVQGNKATTLIVRNGGIHERELSDQTAELIRIFESLDVRGQTLMLSFAYEMETQHKKETGEE